MKSPSTLRYCLFTLAVFCSLNAWWLALNPATRQLPIWAACFASLWLAAGISGTRVLIPIEKCVIRDPLGLRVITIVGCSVFGPGTSMIARIILEADGYYSEAPKKAPLRSTEEKTVDTVPELAPQGV